MTPPPCLGTGQGQGHSPFPDLHFPLTPLPFGFITPTCFLPRPGFFYPLLYFPLTPFTLGSSPHPLVLFVPSPCHLLCWFNLTPVLGPHFPRTSAQQPAQATPLGSPPYPHPLGPLHCHACLYMPYPPPTPTCRFWTFWLVPGPHGLTPLPHPRLPPDGTRYPCLPTPHLVHPHLHGDICPHCCSYPTCPTPILTTCLT